jgi:hypothetical protein
MSKKYFNWGFNTQKQILTILKGVFYILIIKFNKLLKKSFNKSRLLCGKIWF